MLSVKWYGLLEKGPKMKIATVFLFVCLMLSSALAGLKPIFIGNVGLRLGMHQDTVINRLSEYFSVTASSAGYLIQNNNSESKSRPLLGVISFKGHKLTFINKIIDISGVPDDKGASVALAFYDALNEVIQSTDTDGAKRAKASLVISNQDVQNPSRGSLRSIDLYIDGVKVSISITDRKELESVGVSIIVNSNGG